MKRMRGNWSTPDDVEEHREPSLVQRPGEHSPVQPTPLCTGSASPEPCISPSPGHTTQLHISTAARHKLFVRGFDSVRLFL